MDAGGVVDGERGPDAHGAGGGALRRGGLHLDEVPPLGAALGSNMHLLHCSAARSGVAAP